ncbi:MAG: hypothetical protein Q9205_006048 [Flavoplaca limonia]
MSSRFSPIPNEILIKILNYVMQSNTPVETAMLARLAKLSYPDKVPSPTLVASNTTKLVPAKPCAQPLCQWFTQVQHSSRCLCDLKPKKYHQAKHLKDWVLANGVSHRFRRLAKEAFFTAKVFVIKPKVLHQLQASATTSSLLKYSQRIVVPLPACSAESAWLTLPRYQQFTNLRVLAIWPGTDRYNEFPNIVSGKLKQEPASELIQTLLRDIGLERDNLRIDMIRSANDEWWHSDMIPIETRVVPYLRWVGEQRKKKQQKTMEVDISPSEANIGGEKVGAEENEQ